MARQKFSPREGYRDAYTFWIQMDVASQYNYYLDALKQELSDILIPWNSSIERFRQPAPRADIYRFIFGAGDLAAANSVAEAIVCKMNEMERRWEAMQQLHEPLGWMEPEHNARVDVLAEEARQSLADDCGFKRGA